MGVHIVLVEVARQPTIRFERRTRVPYERAGNDLRAAQCNEFGFQIAEPDAAVEELLVRVCQIGQLLLGGATGLPCFRLVTELLERPAILSNEREKKLRLQILLTDEITTDIPEMLHLITKRDLLLYRYCSPCFPYYQPHSKTHLLCLLLLQSVLVLLREHYLFPLNFQRSRQDYQHGTCGKYPCS